MELSISVLGELAVQQNGEQVALPASKRTRALLAYLALTARPHRRDRLCEVFWKVPDDPRGSLRWSLSKLRPILNSENTVRIYADRERVTFLADGVSTDLQQIAEKMADENASLGQLQDALNDIEKPFLDGIDLHDQELFQRWLIAERLEVEKLKTRLLARLSQHGELAITEQLVSCRQWLEVAPYDTAAASQLINLLERLGETEEAKRTLNELKNRFQKADIPWTLESESPVQTEDSHQQSTKRELLARQKVQFCAAEDGVRIAYATLGKGTPIVKAANWLSHLELDWDAPIWSPLFRELAADHTFVRYDERGNGLSDWDVDDISFDAFVTDLETVVEASDVDKFALLGISQGAAVSIEYAVRHPERVSHLILFGGYAAGWRIGADEQTTKQREAVITLTEAGWGQDNPAYRQIFSSTFMPSANADELNWFNEFQRLTTSPENAARFLSVFSDMDVRHRLKEIQVPTLVIHSLRDLRIPADVGRDLAASIPNAEFVGLDSDGHLLLGRESASDDFVEAVRRFISGN